MRTLPLTVSVAGTAAAARVMVPVLCRLPTMSLPEPLVRPAMSVRPLMLVKVDPDPAETSSTAPETMVTFGLFEK